MVTVKKKFICGVCKKAVVAAAALFLFINPLFANKSGLNAVIDGFSFFGVSGACRSALSVSCGINKTSDIISRLFSLKSSKNGALKSSGGDNYCSQGCHSAPPGAVIAGFSKVKFVKSFSGHEMCPLGSKIFRYALYSDPGGVYSPESPGERLLFYFVVLLFFFASSRKDYCGIVGYKKIIPPACI